MEGGCPQAGIHLTSWKTPSASLITTIKVLLMVTLNSNKEVAALGLSAQRSPCFLHSEEQF